MTALGYTFWGVCKGVTKAGTPCRRIVVYANGFCRAHGGDSSDYMKAVAERLKRKAQRRHLRWQRKMRRLHGGTATDTTR